MLYIIYIIIEDILCLICVGHGAHKNLLALKYECHGGLYFMMQNYALIIF